MGGIFSGISSVQYLGSISQCGIFSGILGGIFSIFKTTNMVPIPRYLERNAAYRHRTNFSPTAGHCSSRFAHKFINGS